MKIDRGYWMDKLKGGVISAVLVPRQVDGTIHQGAQKSYVNYIAGKDIRGVAVWAHTGRGLFLNHEQRESVMRDWRKEISSDKIVVAGVGAQEKGNGSFEEKNRKYIAESMEMAEHAIRLGADAFLIYPPVFYTGRDDSDDLILKYHRAIAELNHPMILFYLSGSLGGLSYSMEFLPRLMQIEQVVGIKSATMDSVITYQGISGMISERFPDIVLISGEDRWLGYSIMRGAGAALLGMSSACPELEVDLLEAHFKKDAQRFLHQSNRVDAFAEATYALPLEGYILRMLWTLYMLDIIPEDACNDPDGPALPVEQKENLRKAMESLGLLKSKR